MSSKIDGTNLNGFDSIGKTTASKRAVKGKLHVEKGKCPYCGHNKIFKGNSMGQMINKCCKCKKRIE
jgi:uncharacterized protein (DUF983 family)